MAPVLYLPTTSAAPPITPAVDTTFWFSSTPVVAAYARMNTSKLSSSQVTDSFAHANPWDECFRIFCSPPLSGSGTLSGTMSFAIQTHSTTFTNSITPYVVIRIFAPDGVTVRGIVTPGTAHGNGCAFFAGVSFNSNYISALTINSISYSDGDYIVLEVGCDYFTATSDTGFLMFGDNQASDLPIGSQTTTTTLNPHLDFSATLAFKAFPSGVNNSLMMMGVGT